MNELLRLTKAVSIAGGLFVAALIFNGCETTEPTTNAGTNQPMAVLDNPGTGRLRPNDLLNIVFSGVTAPPDKFEGRIKEDGHISLPLIGDVMAATKMTAELEKDIHDLYVPKYFVRLTVNVNSENRFFYVDGEVNNRSRQVYAGEMTVVRAIAAAGGFTDFANKRKVQLIRANGELHTINYNKAKIHPDLDLPVYPGDKIIVKRRWI